MFQCRPYSPDKPKHCYQVISDQVIGAITEWLLRYPPKSTVNDNGQNEVEPVESKEAQSVDIEEAPESEETKEIEVDAQNGDDDVEQVQSQQMEQEPEETKSTEQNADGLSTDPPPSTIGIHCSLCVQSR